MDKQTYKNLYSEYRKMVHEIREAIHRAPYCGMDDAIADQGNYEINRWLESNPIILTTLENADQRDWLNTHIIHRLHWYKNDSSYGAFKD